MVVFYKICKNYNEIQLRKNKMDFNNKQIKNSSTLPHTNLFTIAIGEFLGNLNGHHQEWVGSTTTNRHGVAAIDFATVSGCEQLVIGPTLDLLMTDVPDLVRVAVVAPFGSSDHSSLSIAISMA